MEKFNVSGWRSADDRIAVETFFEGPCYRALVWVDGRDYDAVASRKNGPTAAIAAVFIQAIDAERDAAVRLAVGPLAALLTQVAEFLADKDGGGPLYSAWEQGDIGNFDDRELTFEETIDAILEERDVLTGIVNVPAVKVYRDVVDAIERLTALAAEGFPLPRS